MARTTKVVNKRTTSSKNSNTSKSKGFFGKSFDLKSRKVQFFVVILIVAILGGGYFTLKSFAATALDTYTVSNAKLTSFNPTEIINNNCTANKVTDKDKNNTVVMGLTCRAGSLASKYSISARSKSITFSPSSKNFRYCAIVKGASPELTIQPKYQNLSSVSAAVKYTNFRTDNYTEVCSNWFKVTSSKSSPISGYVSIKANQSNSSLIAVSSMTLQVQ